MSSAPALAHEVRKLSAGPWPGLPRGAEENHPWSDLADSATYVIAGVVPTRAQRRSSTWSPEPTKGVTIMADRSRVPCGAGRR